MQAYFPDTEQGARDALRNLARPHLVASVQPAAEPGHWKLRVRFAKETETVTVSVYVGDHPLAADFERHD